MLMRRLPRCVDIDDLVQAGHVGVLEARARYKDDDTAQFNTFATHRIRGAMLDYLRSTDPLSRAERKKQNAINRSTVQTPKDIRQEEYDEPAVEYETPELPGTPKRLQKALAKLSANEQYVLRTEFWLGGTQDQAAHALGLTPSRICQLRKEALAKLRRSMEILPW